MHGPSLTGKPRPHLCPVAMMHVKVQNHDLHKSPLSLRQPATVHIAIKPQIMLTARAVPAQYPHALWSVQSLVSGTKNVS